LRFLEAPAQYPGAGSHSDNAISVLNRGIRKRWRAEQEQEHEKIKCGKINFLAGSHRCNRIFGAG
jgi:hypothetical protein